MAELKLWLVTAFSHQLQIILAESEDRAAELSRYPEEERCVELLTDDLTQEWVSEDIIRD